MSKDMKKWLIVADHTKMLSYKDVRSKTIVDLYEGTSGVVIVPTLQVLVPQFKY